MRLFSDKENVMAKRDIVVSVLLTIVTCGIYGIYWFIKMTDEVNVAACTPSDTSGGVAFLFSLITCGIYEIYWAYKIGNKLDNCTNQNSSRGLTYLLLSIFGLSIIAYALIQDSINKMYTPLE